MVCPPAMGTTPRERNVPTNIPSMRALMDDPIFRAYMKTPPRPLHALKTGNPWRVWVDRGSGRWATAEYPSYLAAWRTFVQKYRADPSQDITIVSKRVFYAPPGEWYKVRVRKPRRPTPDDKSTTKVVIETRWRQKFLWDGVDLHWCGRCRRPVYWMPLFPDHHALRKSPAISDEDNYRCLICGIRWITTPLIEHMEKIEARPS
jgi:hypothetical protein